MTWGSSCPQCGHDECSWTAGKMCEGLHKMAIRAAVEAQKDDNEQVRGMLDEFFHACPIADGKIDADQYGMELFHRLSDWTYQRGEFVTRAQTGKDDDAQRTG